MKTFRPSWFFLAYALMAEVQALGVTATPAAATNARQSQDVPWTMRYVLFVDTEKGMATAFSLAKQSNASDRERTTNNIYLDADELLPSPTIFRVPGKVALAATLLSFNRNGRVISSDALLSQFIGKLTTINRLVLEHDSGDSKPYYFANWSTGIPGDISFSPALCTTLDDHRYDLHWKSGRSLGDFGCREWTAQLYNWERPYIDVTTYTKHGNFIGEFVGWSRFEDAPKPVIGMHGKTWLCLHECPLGERPGVIADLRNWTRKHGYPMPVPPPYQPEYPNKNYKDDLNECCED
ncbi:MAG: hypothetical protein V4476_26385 [Pseudomonadota bacterium]